jgi:hypothetical protein
MKGEKIESSREFDVYIWARMGWNKW